METEKDASIDLTEQEEINEPNSERSLDVLIDGAKRIGIDLTQRQLAQFTKHYEEMVEWNRRANLTSITEWDQVLTRHFLDSLSVVKAFDDRSLDGACLIDIGTGAGFPGVPLNIAFPDLHVTLMDATGKKTAFLEHLVEVTELSNAQVVRGRAETVAHDPNHREKYDFAVARAVASLSALSELALPFLKTNGIFIAQKSADIEEEAKASKKANSILGGSPSRILSVDIPELGAARSLVRVKKLSHTSMTYPRRPGMPAKNPL